MIVTLGDLVEDVVVELGGPVNVASDTDASIERRRGGSAANVAAVVGGLGLAPGANIGSDAAIFEAVHGSAPDIAGRNIANPCALLLASAQMLVHLGMGDRADRLRNAIKGAIAAGDRVTPDLGGDGRTDDFAEAIIDRF